jgi:hypothetical protein
MYEVMIYADSWESILAVLLVVVHASYFHDWGKQNQVDMMTNKYSWCYATNSTSEEALCSTRGCLSSICKKEEKCGLS